MDLADLPSVFDGFGRRRIPVLGVPYLLKGELELAVVIVEKFLFSHL